MSDAYRHLPPRAVELLDVIGLEPLRALVGRWGGTRLYVPQPVPPEHTLAHHLGAEAANALADRFGGDYLVVPRCAAALRAARDADIRRCYTGGESAARLARRHGLTERQIWRILSQPDPASDELQLQLFSTPC